jgi:hypothetical protein
MIDQIVAGSEETVVGGAAGRPAGRVGEDLRPSCLTATARGQKDAMHERELGTGRRVAWTTGPSPRPNTMPQPSVDGWFTRERSRPGGRRHLPGRTPIGRRPTEAPGQPGRPVPPAGIAGRVVGVPAAVVACGTMQPASPVWTCGCGGPLNVGRLSPGPDGLGVAVTKGGTEHRRTPSSNARHGNFSRCSGICVLLRSDWKPASCLVIRANLSSIHPESLVCRQSWKSRVFSIRKSACQPGNFQMTQSVRTT